MDFVDYSPATDGSKSFPNVAASSSNPQTLHQAHSDVTYINVGSGWVPACQESSGSVYSGYSTLPAATQTNVVNKLSAATPVLPAKSVKTAVVLVRGR